MEIQLAVAGTVTQGPFAMNRAKLDVVQKKKVVDSLRIKLDLLKDKLIAASKKEGIKVPRIGQDPEQYHRRKAVKNPEYQALSEEHYKAVEALRAAREKVKQLKPARRTKTIGPRLNKGTKDDDLPPIKR